RPDPLIELLGSDESELECSFLQRGSFLVRRLGDLRRLVVADVRIERGDQHQRLAHQLPDPLAVGLDSHGAVVVEAPAAVGAPWANTSASCAASASNLFGAEVNGCPVSFEISAATRSPNSG